MRSSRDPFRPARDVFNKFGAKQTGSGSAGEIAHSEFRRIARHAKVCNPLKLLVGKISVNILKSCYFVGFFGFFRPLPTLYPANIHDTARSRSVVVPNIGGLAGFSLRFPNANVNMSYRVDAFFGAIDGGLATRKTYDRNFYGPFATISIGLGG